MSAFSRRISDAYLYKLPGTHRLYKLPGTHRIAWAGWIGDTFGLRVPLAGGHLTDLIHGLEHRPAAVAIAVPSGGPGGKPGADVLAA